MPIGDGLIVLRNHGPRATVFGVHWATAAGMLVTVALLLASPA